MLKKLLFIFAFIIVLTCPAFAEDFHLAVNTEWLNGTYDKTGRIEDKDFIFMYNNAERYLTDWYDQSNVKYILDYEKCKMLQAKDAAELKAEILVSLIAHHIYFDFAMAYPNDAELLAKVNKVKRVFATTIVYNWLSEFIKTGYSCAYPTSGPLNYCTVLVLHNIENINEQDYYDTCLLDRNTILSLDHYYHCLENKVPPKYKNPITTTQVKFKSTAIVPNMTNGRLDNVRYKDNTIQFAFSLDQQGLSDELRPYFTLDMVLGNQIRFGLSPKDAGKELGERFSKQYYNPYDLTDYNRIKDLAPKVFEVLYQHALDMRDRKDLLWAIPLSDPRVVAVYFPDINDPNTMMINIHYDPYRITQ